MPTAFFSHPACLRHDTGADHPETARRLSAIADRLLASGLSNVLQNYDAPVVSREQLLRVHDSEYVDAIEHSIPEDGFARLDPDTIVSPGSLDAAWHAAGALTAAVDLVVAGTADNAFCAVRPPGHHAERNEAMGFCLFNNVAVGAAHALAAHGLARVAIVDFDVHHGNGTEDMFNDDDRVLFCSTFQHPYFPYTPLRENTPNRISMPLEAGAGSDEFRNAVREQWLPALERFEPELILVSAGFDAHVADDMAMLNLVDDDYRWVTEKIVAAAQASASGRIVSTLEGGYELHSLARCTEIHLRVLMDLH
ncbi:MAG: histone deacetylase family protein [Woeseiaceae bacterium]